MMKKIGGGLEGNKPYALYQCERSHLTKVFSNFRGIVFSKWENAPKIVDWSCLGCNENAPDEGDE